MDLPTTLHLHLLSDCPQGSLHYGDGICDDYNNNPECDFDGGDCCLTSVDKQRCTECLCKKHIKHGGHHADNHINPPEGKRCTNVSMWSDVYWVAETVDECKSTVITHKTFETKEVPYFLKLK